MIKKIFTLFLLFLLFPFLGNAQNEEDQETKGHLNVSLESNAQWYIDDDKIQLDQDEAEERFRSNSYLKADYYYGDFSVGVQIEAYEPKPILNYSPDLDGVNIGTVYAKYDNREAGLSITAGHFYEQFGSGLVLRSWEDRQLGINNAILGGKVEFAPSDALDITILGGKQRTGMGFDLSDGALYGADLESDLSDIFSIESIGLDLGLSYVGRYQDQTDEYSNAPKTVSEYSGRLGMTSGNFYISGEYVYKTEDLLVEQGTVFNDIKNPGNATLLNFGYSQRGLGVDVNLRRMENMGFFSERNFAGNVYNQGIVNYLPALTKQYDYSLQNIYVYQSQPNLAVFQSPKTGEIGGQIDLFYEFKRNTTLGGKYGTNIALNGSYWAGLDSNFNRENASEPTYDADYLGFGKKYYRDFGLEVRKKWSKDWSSIFTYLNQYYNRKFIEDRTGQINTNIVSAEVTHKFGKSQSLRLEGEHQWADAAYKNWWGATIEYGLNYNWSIYLHDIYNYGNDDSAEKIHYYNAGVSYSTGATRLAMSYGRQRGGLLCVGGVCRIVSEAAGLTINISTSF